MKIWGMILTWIMNAEIPIATLKEWLDDVDADHNGRISVQELIKWVKDWYNAH